MTETLRHKLVVEIGKYLRTQPVGCTVHLDLNNDHVIDIFDATTASNPKLTSDDEIQKIWTKYQSCKQKPKDNFIIIGLILFAVFIIIYLILR